SVADIRHMMTKHGGNLGESGSVAWQFENRGVLTLPSSGVAEDDLFDVAVEFGAEEIDEEDGQYVISVPAEKAFELRQALMDRGLPDPAVEVGLEPTNTVTVTGEEAQRLLKLLEDLEEHDDIEKVSSNFDISQEDMEAYTA
ncbi:MAG: YebC/PmpR family DNA-binding transcriptional regulator, partial [Candidatus Marinimicrobia bacterium]|nr:YebC/PmpR family DNA-binding transcriptional regulator [Candidatus Neomarinimicrobiota bacterium]